MIVTAEIVCSGRDKPERGQYPHRAVPVALFMIDGVNQWTPVVDASGVKELRHGRAGAFYRREGEERVAMRLPDGTELRTGEETVWVECRLCARKVQARANRWTSWIDERRARGVSLDISDGEFI